MNDTDKDKALITAFVDAGLELREWEEDGYTWRLQWGGDREQCYRIEMKTSAGWAHHVALADYQSASIILRQLQERAEEAGVEACGTGMDDKRVYACVGDMGRWLQEDGTWKLHGAGTAATFASRPEALITACVAIGQEA